MDAILASLPGEQIRVANSLGTVTDNWIVVRPASGARLALLSLDSIVGITRIKTTYPGLLVIAAGIALIAAAAYFSKQGSGAAAPMAVIAFFFLAAYFGTRRASVLFQTSLESIETTLGSLRDAAELESAVRRFSERPGHEQTLTTI